MSRSDLSTASSIDFDLLKSVNDKLEGLARRLEPGVWPDDQGFEEAGRLFGLAVRIYTAAAEAQSDEVPLPELGITATDAVIGAASLLKDQNLTPFELSIWHTRVISRASQSNSYKAGTN